MASKIGPTPVLRGDTAVKFKADLDNVVPTGKNEETLKKCVELAKKFEF